MTEAAKLTELQQKVHHMYNELHLSSSKIAEQLDLSTSRIFDVLNEIERKFKVKNLTTNPDHIANIDISSKTYKKLIRSKIYSISECIEILDDALAVRNLGLFSKLDLMKAIDKHLGYICTCKSDYITNVHSKYETSKIGNWGEWLALSERIHYLLIGQNMSPDQVSKELNIPASVIPNRFDRYLYFIATQRGYDLHSKFHIVNLDISPGAMWELVKCAKYHYITDMVHISLSDITKIVGIGSKYGLEIFNAIQKFCSENSITVKRKYKIFVETTVFAEDEEQAKKMGYDAIINMCSEQQIGTVKSNIKIDNIDR